jgi:hypothetical protein
VATRTVVVGTCPTCGTRVITYRKRSTGLPTVGLHFTDSSDKPCRGKGQPAYAPATEER